MKSLPEEPPSKVAGFIYLFLGLFSLGVAAFVLVIPQSFWGATNFRIGIGIVMALWGIFRITTGVRIIRQANAAEKRVKLEGTSSANQAHSPKS